MNAKFVLAALLCCGSVSADLKVTNHKDNSVVRYACVLLKGTCGSENDSAADANLTIQVVQHSGSPATQVADNHVTDNDVAIDVSGGSFKALAKLAKGKNTITISDKTSGEKVELKITYQVQTNPYYVRLIWLTDSGGDTTYATALKNDPQDYIAKVKTAGLLMQTATAEKMHDLDRERQTFRLERDANGEVIVHTLKAAKPREHYYSMGDQDWWRDTLRWLNRTHPDPFAKNVVLASFTRKDADTGKMKAHTALGGGNLGLFGSASVFSWPSSIKQTVATFSDSSTYDSTAIHNDSAGRNRIWGLASTTLGATLHETGHTFGLPHCTDRYGVMTRGFDRFNRIFTVVEPPSDANRQQVTFQSDQEARFGHVSASYLQLSPWFQADGPGKTRSIPKLKFDAQTGQLEISADSGIAWIGVHSGSDIHGFLEYSGDDRKSQLKLSMEELVRAVNGQAVSRVEAVSASGQTTRISISSDETHGHSQPTKPRIKWPGLHQILKMGGLRSS
ncbi:MAG: metallopeptidase [Fuerstiella sp.]